MNRLSARLDRIAAKVSALPCRVCRNLRPMLFCIGDAAGDPKGEQKWTAIGGQCPRCGREPDRVTFTIVDGPDAA